MKCAVFNKRYQCVHSAGKALVIEGLHSEPVQPELNGSSLYANGYCFRGWDFSIQYGLSYFRKWNVIIVL